MSEENTALDLANSLSGEVFGGKYVVTQDMLVSDAKRAIVAPLMEQLAAIPADAAEQIIHLNTHIEDTHRTLAVQSDEIDRLGAHVGKLKQERAEEKALVVVMAEKYAQMEKERNALQEEVAKLEKQIRDEEANGPF